MASQRHNKKEVSIKVPFTKTPAKKIDPPQEKATDTGAIEEAKGLDSDNTPITKSLLEQLFGFSDSFATLKQEIATEIKDLKREVVDLGQRVNALERTHDAREEELDHHRCKLITLQKRNQ
ncbi:hypothetical protein NDU88_000786 [Pleurodeles waltl]|uniref:Uncharacterized protein n=1 Tax=Pleurodeles waltl TaxID=8319 RepID=A0AAV7R739_PLEWA|nr:hypothetical protein NDU88_000786 [Pleurodeles waltl]